MVNSQPQPNVPHNRPSSQGYNIPRTHNPGLPQVSVMTNPTMISTAKPLTVRPKTKATLKTPDGKEIKLDDDSASKTSSTTTTPSTNAASTAVTTTTTTEHVQTLLQKVSEDTVDSKKGAIEEKVVEEKKNDTTNDKKKPANHTVGDNKKTEDNCVVADKAVKEVETAVDDQKRTVVPETERAAEMDDKENKIQIQDDETVEKEIADPKKDETEAPEAQQAKDIKETTNEAQDDTKEANSKTEDKEDESSNSLKYEPGQYHPINNTSGKKKYSREFLMQVCSIVGEAEHITFPQNIKIDPFDISERFGLARHIGGSRQNDSNRRHGQNNYSGRSSAGQEKQRIVISSASLNQEVELKTSSNPWRPAKDVKEEVPQDVVDTDSLKKKFRSILNKLTPNNFESLAQSVTLLNIDTESKLGDVIDIVFAKALAEPGYCVLYGQMCSHLKKTTAEGTNFGNTLLKRCQSQFQSDIYSGLNLEERRKAIEDEQDPAAKKQLEEELYEDMYRCRMRGLGLIKFIGELYKIEMLNDAIMFDCVLRLLADKSEEALECLCDLLVTIGEKLDRSTSQKVNAEKEKNKTKGSVSRTNAYHGGQKLSAVVSGTQSSKVESPSLDSVFEQLHKIRKNEGLPLSKRIRFKLLDTCDLREKDRWQSKKTKDNNPKKIEEIREAHKEKLEEEKRQVNAMGPRRSQEHRRLGHSGNSSNQISSSANESGGYRGNLHTSASSHLLHRDHSVGDQRANHSDAERKDFKASLAKLMLKTVSTPSTNTALRPTYKNSQ